MDVLNAPATPLTSVSPTADKIVLLEPLRYPPISELAATDAAARGFANQSEYKRRSIASPIPSK